MKGYACTKQQSIMLSVINQILITIFFSLPVLYFVVSILTKPKQFKTRSHQRRYDFLIVARNEEKVIGDLIDSIHQQQYPKALIRIFVLADNCLDQTATIAKAHGAITFINQMPNHVGKGLALKTLIAHRNQYPGTPSDGVFFFDADNILDAEFTLRMNNAYNGDDTILIGYRASKNFASNATSMGSSIIFFREAHFLHHARNRLGFSTHINGTGFMLSNSIVKNEPWQAFSLIEDVEFTILQLMKERHVLFVRQAKFYDEQPTLGHVSFKQRLRWIKGGIQIYILHGGKLLVSLLKKFKFAKVDLLLWITPFPSIMIVLSLINLAINQISFILEYPFFSIFAWIPIYQWLGQFLGFSFIIGATTVLASWKELRASFAQKIWAMMTFPFYSLSFLPIFIIAPLTMFNLKWYKTPHSVRGIQSSDSKR
jgi:cellulose synthase/poly-beta-1,6-N-acetylglucosamine synthase-like glycosyltransferase